MTEPTNRTRRPFVIEEGMAILARTPAVLDALLRGLPEGWIAAHEGGTSWSPFEIVGHLIQGECTNWVVRLRHVLESGEAKAFEPFDRLPKAAAGAGQTLGSRLDEFAELRRGNLAELEALRLSPADLERRSTHPAFGAVTLGQLLATWVAHDLDHLTQIARVLAAQYADAVGPWRAYLRVISGQPG